MCAHTSFIYICMEIANPKNIAANMSPCRQL